MYLSLLIVPDGGPTNVGWAQFAQALGQINEVRSGSHQHTMSDTWLSPGLTTHPCVHVTAIWRHNPLLADT
jgi:hypothetical protein